MVRSLRILILLLIALAAWPAAAHLTPNSEISLEIGRSHIEADIVIPLGELQYAEPQFAKLASATLSPAQTDRIAHYFAAHVAAKAPDGRPWSVRLLRAKVDGEPADLQARLALIPPAGAPVRSLGLRYDAVIDHIPNHIALIALKSDFDAGHLSDHPELLGGLRQGDETITIDRGPGSGWRGFLAAIGLGIHHIAQGHDHLLFLIALLLPAPLLAAAGRWAGYAGGRKTWRSLALIVTAFTIGHSATLIGGAFLGWQLPARPVEILIALSILISAIHAWRPLFAGREAVVAGGFGLVHGLAFATIIGRFGLDPWQKAQSILGFNLGIELVQLIVVALVMPALILLARSDHYRHVRPAGAAIAGIAATLWIIERTSGRDFAPARLVDNALGYAPWLFLLAFVAAIAVLLRQRLSSASRTYGGRQP